MYKYTYYIKCQLCQYNSLIALAPQVQISVFQISVVGKREFPSLNSKISTKYPHFLPFMPHLSHFSPEDVFANPINN